MSRTSAYIPSLEAISYQGKSKLFQELTARFEGFLSAGVRDTASLQKLDLETLIQAQTGLPTHIVIDHEDESVSAGAVIPLIDLNSPLMKGVQELLRAAQDMFPVEFHDDASKTYRQTLKESDLLGQSKLFMIDRTRSYIKAPFGELRFDIILSKGLLEFDLTGAEAAAVLLHEIGHLFTYFEWMLKTATTNVVLDASWKAYSQTQDQSQKLRLVDTTAQLLGTGPLDKTTLPKSQDAYFTLFLSLALPKLRSNLGSQAYDYRIAEQAADQFTARHGASRDMMSFLMKFHRSGLLGSFFFGSDPAYYSMIAMNSAMALAIALFSWPAALIMTLGFLYFLAMPAMDSGEYDDPKQRLLKLQRELIHALKRPHLNKKERDQLLRDYQTSQDLMATFKARDSLFMMVWRNMTSGRRDQHAQLRFQQELEALSNNALYVKAHSLKTLTA